MIILVILVALISIYEIHGMWKEKQKKDIAVFITFAALTALFGYFYIQNPYRKSLSDFVLDFLRLKH